MISKKAQTISPSATLAIDSKFKAMKEQGLDVVGFGAGEPDFDTPQHIKDAAITAINEGKTKYTPASGTLELRNAIVRKFKRENGLDYAAGDIVVSNGAKHSLVNTFMAICNPGDEVIIISPFWVSYPEMVKLADGVPVIIETTEDEDFKASADKIRAAITDKTRAIILNSPSNPTGMIYNLDELKEIAQIAVENNIYIVSDEIYEHLIYEGKHVSIATLSEEVKDLTIIVNGVSKTYAMTGWRIGYTASNSKLAKVMGNIQSHATSNPNSIAQSAAVAALDGGLECVEEMKKAFVERRNYMVDRINSIEGVSCKKPNGAFYIMMNISDLIGKTFYGKTITTAFDLSEALLDIAKLAVVPCESFGDGNYVRWSYATSMENVKEGLDRLEKFLKNQY